MTTSLLECAVRDVAGERICVVRLVPPRACPGHFDATPRDLEQIAQASAFLRHDYQEYLDKRLTQAGKRPRRAFVIPTAGAQTIPANYLSMCREVCAVLSECFPSDAAAFRERLAATTLCLQDMGNEIREQAAPKLKGKTVVASQLQKEFCEWAGLKVVATFDNADQASLRGIEATLQAARRGGTQAVVCNLQRGTQEGSVLGERMGLPVIILSNFPDMAGPEGGYRALLEENMRALVAGLRHE